MGEDFRWPGGQIIEEWVETHRDTPPADQVSELIRLLDAARRAVDLLTQRAA